MRATHEVGQPAPTRYPPSALGAPAADLERRGRVLPSRTARKVPPPARCARADCEPESLVPGIGPRRVIPVTPAAARSGRIAHPRSARAPASLVPCCPAQQSLL